MKTIVALFLLWMTPLRAIDLVLEWDATPPEFQTESYNIYEITSPSERVKIGNVKDPVFTVQGIMPGFHRYAVTLVNLWGESVTYASGETPPVFPSPLQTVPLKFRTVNVQASTDMEKWENIAAVVVPDSRRAFYRLSFTP